MKDLLLMFARSAAGWARGFEFLADWFDEVGYRQ